MRFLIVLLAVATIAMPDASYAQLKASPRGSVSQTLDGTKIEIEYARPALRGREGLFGGQIFWGHVWTPGADEATTLTVNKDIMIDSTAVPAGKYSMWFIVQPGDWEVVLNPEWDLYHVPEPERSDDWITFMVTPDTTAPKTEVLTFDFPENEAFSTTLRFRFDERQVNLHIDVPSRLNKDVTEADVTPYTGVFATEVLVTAYSPQAYDFDMPFLWKDSTFVAAMKWGPVPEGKDEAPGMDMQLLPSVEQVFFPVFYEDGEIVASAEFFFEFLMGDDGRAASFELRTPDDELWMRGTRKE